MRKSVREAGAKSTRTVVRYLAEQGVEKKSGELPKETVRSADRLSLAAKGTKQGGRGGPVRFAADFIDAETDQWPLLLP